jgi:hypothetical protein
VLHDPGRSNGTKSKPKGSVHGASVGLHAADSANAWRGIAEQTDASNANACLVTAAWHAAGQSGRMDRSQPHHASARESAERVPPDELLGAVAEALRGGDQRLSCALTVEFARTRPASRWAHLIALTRVMASGYGFEAQGLDLSRRLLGA